MGTNLWWVLRKGESGCTGGWYDRKLWHGTALAQGTLVWLQSGPCMDTMGEPPLAVSISDGLPPLLIPVGESDVCAVCALGRRILVSIFMFYFNFKPQEGYRKCW